MSCVNDDVSSNIFAVVFAECHIITYSNNSVTFVLLTQNRNYIKRNLTEIKILINGHAKLTVFVDGHLEIETCGRDENKICGLFVFFL